MSEPGTPDRHRHGAHYALRMLFLLTRPEGTLSEEDASRLDDWLSKMRKENAALVYMPDTEDGFYYVYKDDFIGNTWPSSYTFVVPTDGPTGHPN